MADPVPVATFPATPVVVGCWSWGDTRTWGYGTRFGHADLRAAVETLTSAGLYWFDTAEVYAGGQSERLLGELLAGRTDVAVSTKFFPYPWRLGVGAFRRALLAGLRRLRRDRVQLYQIHHEVPRPLARHWASCLAAARREGLVEAIGTSNLSAVGLHTMIDALARHGERVAAHQTRYNLCDRRVERHGVPELCRANGITLLAHSALGQGLLSGRYRAGRPMPGRRALPEPGLRQAEPVLKLLDRYADRLGTTPASVALAWLRRHGATPIVGVHDAAQAKDLAAGVGVVLPDGIASRLDVVTEPWQGRR